MKHNSEVVPDVGCNINTSYFRHTIHPGGQNHTQIYKKLPKILPTAMLVSLVTYNSLFTDVYIKAIAEIKFQLHLLHLKECFMQERQ